MKTQPHKVLTTESSFQYCPLWRRLAAIFYDSIVLVSLIFVAWQPVPLLPDQFWPPWLGQSVRLAYLGTICFLFFGWFWTHGGQTLGMRAWRIKLIGRPIADVESRSPDVLIDNALIGEILSDDALSGDTLNDINRGAVKWQAALLRFICAILSWAAFGLGFFWSLFSRNRQSWHDLASSTSLIVLAKQGKRRA